MGHPLDDSYDARRSVRDAIWERRDAIEARINKISLAEFSASYFADLALLYDRKAVSERTLDLVNALNRLESFLEVRA